MATGAEGEVAVPSAKRVWWTFGLVVAAAILGGLIFVVTDPKLYLDPEGFAVFAPIYVAAQAIERLLEPIAVRYNTTEGEKQEVKDAREEKLAVQNRLAYLALPSAMTSEQLNAAETELSELRSQLESVAINERSKVRALEVKRTERKLTFFLLASLTSCLFAGVLGLGLYEAMSTQPLEEYLGAIDVAITGLVIGAGTKPLHDLIVRLEKSKENADAADKPTSALGTVATPPSTGSP